MNWQQASALIAQEKRSASRKRMLLYWPASLSNLYPTYSDSLLMQLLFTNLQRRKRLVLYLFVGALTAKHVELLQYFGLFGFRSPSDEENLVQPECTSTAYDVADVVALADVMKQQISSWLIFLHKIILQYQQSENNIININKGKKRKVQISFVYVLLYF